LSGSYFFPTLPSKYPKTKCRSPTPSITPLRLIFCDIFSSFWVPLQLVVFVVWPFLVSPPNPIGFRKIFFYWKRPVTQMPRCFFLYFSSVRGPVKVDFPRRLLTDSQSSSFFSGWLLIVLFSFFYPEESIVPFPSSWMASRWLEFLISRFFAFVFFPREELPVVLFHLFFWRES